MLSFSQINISTDSKHTGLDGLANSFTAAYALYYNLGGSEYNDFVRLMKQIYFFIYLKRMSNLWYKHLKYMYIK